MATLKELWRQYLIQNPNLVDVLLSLPKDTVLTDMFAKPSHDSINQARALGELVEEFHFERTLNMFGGIVNEASKDSQTLCGEGSI